MGGYLGEKLKVRGWRRGRWKWEFCTSSREERDLPPPFVSIIFSLFLWLFFFTFFSFICNRSEKWNFVVSNIYTLLFTFTLLNRNASSCYFLHILILWKTKSQINLLNIKQFFFMMMISKKIITHPNNQIIFHVLAPMDRRWVLYVVAMI